jgi:LemA protein
MAGAQLAHALTMTRTRPLDPEAVAALSASQYALDEAVRPTDDGALSKVVAGLTDRLRQLAVQAEAPAALFDAAVQTYNAAIRQFPASLLARVWGFRPAGLMGWPGPDRRHGRHPVTM